MPESMNINSHKGVYNVYFQQSIDASLIEHSETNAFYIMDKRIAELYPHELKDILCSKNIVLIEAKEENKSLENIIPVIENLVEAKVRRTHTLIAVGGGIIQDITCFIASTFLRGIAWKFIPTTLLAQADSCIGSKSSINLNCAKNILGTFYPPQEIFVFSQFLDSLEHKEVLSGVGEIIKVHAIKSKDKFDLLASNYSQLFADKSVLLKFIRAALEIKKEYIEEDEFDKGIRNIFNYGHSFGHAIEATTNFQIPHGIAVTIGMDMANFVASQIGLIEYDEYLRMHELLQRNYHQYRSTPIELDGLLQALSKDKKNTTSALVLILPHEEMCEIRKVEVVNNADFKENCRLFLGRIKSELN